MFAPAHKKTRRTLGRGRRVVVVRRHTNCAAGDAAHRHNRQGYLGVPSQGGPVGRTSTAGGPRSGEGTAENDRHGGANHTDVAKERWGRHQ